MFWLYKIIQNYITKIDVKYPICGRIEVLSYEKVKQANKDIFVIINNVEQKLFNWNTATMCESLIEGQIINMTANTSCIHDISIVLKISTYSQLQLKE